MQRHDEAIDSAIADTDRIRKLVTRAKDRQMRKGEDRDFLKASALTWFRSRRPLIAEVVPADHLAAIDAPFHLILEATERKSATSTYRSAADAAKSALLAARTAVLTALAVEAVPQNETTPDFSALASDPRMQAILSRRWAECQKCLSSGAALAATVMMGGLLEALFVARANKLNDKAVLFSAAATPLDHKIGKPLQLRQWTLAPYIDVGHEIRWISRSAKDVATILRDYRNYVHPEKERSHGVTLTIDDAKMFWEITKTLSRELLAMKGAV